MPFVPSENAANAQSKGGGTTDTGYYRCKIRLDSEGPGSNPWTTRHIVEMPTGIKPSVLLNWPYDDNQELNPKIVKLDLDEAGQGKKIQNYCDYLYGVCLSAGYTKEDLAQGYDETWLDDREVFVAFVSGDDLGAEYGDIVGYVSGAPDDGLTAEQQFEQFQAEGKLPRAPKSRNAKPGNKGEGGGSGHAKPPSKPSAAPPPKSSAGAKASSDNGSGTMPPPRAKAGGPPRPPAPRRP